MAEYVASSSRSMQMLSETEREIHDWLTLLLEECEMLNANDSGLSKAMRRYVASQVEDILEFMDIVKIPYSKKKKEKKKRGIILRVRGLLGRFVGGQDYDYFGMFFVLMIMGLETRRIFRDWHPGGVNRDRDRDRDRVIERLSGRSVVVLPKVKHFVGMKEDLKQLVSSLTYPQQHQLLSFLTDPQQQQQQQQRVVWVWGVEGLGKTTLAAKVFMDPKVRGYFKAFAWVSLTQGQPYEINSLLQNILEQLAGESSEKSAERSIEQMIGDKQRRQKCLIVIDGIWEISQWEQISSYLLTTDTTSDKDTDSLSRILVTTRDETIACPDGVTVHKPSLLNENDGWELLQKHALCGNACPGKGIIPKLGKEMVRKCEYLPSTISRLGRALSKIPPTEWHTVNEDITRFLKEDDGGKSPSSEQTSVTVAQGYDRLRFHLKQCFLYLGIFKQDIDAEDLTFLWAAEGMLFAQQQDKDNGKIIDTIIDTAERYLQELNSEGMLKVQVDGLSANTMLMPLSLYNDQRALSQYQGEHNAFGLFVSDHSVDDNSVDDIERIVFTRRLVFHFNKQVTSTLPGYHMQETMFIRSLFFLNSAQELVDLPVSMANFKKLKLLRTVHFVRCKFKDRKLPEEIEKLVCLRYLGIIYCDLDKLPSSISKSRELHVLNVRAYGDAKMTIPNIFSQPSKLSQMKHLRLPSNLEKEQSDKLKLDGLHDLETLVGFNVDVHDIHSLSRLEKLRLLVTHVGDNVSLDAIIKLVKAKGSSVQIHVVVENKCNFTSRDELPDLEEMLMCHQLYALTFSMVQIHKFPNCRTLASSGLTQIKLIGCRLREDPMEALGKFRSLRKLCLGYGAFVGSKIEIHRDGGFKHLEYLEFRCLPYLEEWLVDSGAMPSLSTLTVKRCPKLKEIPGGLISCVSSLNNFEIELPPCALSKAKKKEYKKMFSSVKNLIIRKLVG